MRVVTSFVAAALLASSAHAAPSILDQIRHPSSRERHAGMCQTRCQWIGNQQVCNTFCF
jgi:hypothetical protein